MQITYDELKAELLNAGAMLRVEIPLMISLLEQNSRIRRMTRQMFKAIQYLDPLYMMTEVRLPKTDEIEEELEEEHETEKA